ncbi:uncharacterized protein LOC126970106 [Leptidea sinapis]|uniref:uncharacterized protein LOC126970106 n=1 Tax=Leptidea sinapis TaxID=189913 RepID=UPI002141744D|nr:uncharacterized protein LOC126970106 [Leptidea sinapis]
MNELEKLKLDPHKESEARSAEQSLSAWFTQLGAALGASARLSCECVLTAFSVHPSLVMYDKVKDAPHLPLLSKVDTQEMTNKESSSEFGSWATDSRTQTNLVKTSETLKLKQTQKQANILSTAILNEGESIGLEENLCHDLAVLISGPRVKTLSWDMEREALLENCRAYMERTHAGTKALTTELKYLNLDPRSFQHLPEEDDEENNIYYGIEKGYEHLVESQESQTSDIWQDAFFDSSSSSSNNSERSIKIRRRKKKIKRLQVTEEEKDPLSIDTVICSKTENSVGETKERSMSKKSLKKSVCVQEGPEKGNQDAILSISNSDGKTTEQKLKKEKRKERKERKKNVSKPQVDTSEQLLSGLSHLIGLKVRKSPQNIRSEKSTHSEIALNKALDETSSSISDALVKSGNDSNIVYDGQYSIDEMTLSNKSNRDQDCTKNESDHHFVNAASQSSHGDAKSHTIKENTKQSIQKLIGFRRHKNTDKQNINTNSQNSDVKVSDKNEFSDEKFSPKAVSVPKIPSAVISKSQDIKQNHQIDQILREYNSKISEEHNNFNYGLNTSMTSISKSDYHSQKAFQEFVKNHALQPTLLPQNNSTTAKICTPNILKSSRKFGNPATKSVKTSVKSLIRGMTKTVTSKQIQPDTVRKDNYSSKPGMSHDPSQIHYKTFIKELQESLNPGVFNEQKTKANNDNSNTHTTLKQSKMADKVPNTFARLSYLIKNKQMENKLKIQESKVHSGQCIPNALNKMLPPHLQTGEVVIQRVTKQPERKYGHHTTDKSSRKVESAMLNSLKIIADHPHLQNVLSKPCINSYGSDVAMNNSCTKTMENETGSVNYTNTTSLLKPRSVNSGIPMPNHITPATTTTNLDANSKQNISSAIKQNEIKYCTKLNSVSATATSLSEKDQADLLLLLRQQNKLNSLCVQPKNSHDFINVKNSMGSEQNTLQVTNTEMHNSYSSWNTNKQINSIKNDLEAELKPMSNLNKTNSNYIEFKVLQKSDLELLQVEKNSEQSNISQLNQNHLGDRNAQPAREFEPSFQSNQVKNKDIIPKSTFECIPKDTKLINTAPISSNNHTLLNNSKVKYSNSTRRKVSSSPKNKKNLDWQSVFNDLSKHKTPSRGPNALDVALNKVSIENHHIHTISKINNTSNKVISQEKTVIASKSTMDDKDDLKISKTIIRPTYKSTATTIKDSSKKEPNNTDEKLETVSTEKTTFVKTDKMREDPFISGIPNSDYDLLEELMDDDLRQEIGELSDDDAYCPLDLYTQKEKDKLKHDDILISEKPSSYTTKSHKEMDISQDSVGRKCIQSTALKYIDLSRLSINKLPKSSNSSILVDPKIKRTRDQKTNPKHNTCKVITKSKREERRNIKESSGSQNLVTTETSLTNMTDIVINPSVSNVVLDNHVHTVDPKKVLIAPAATATSSLQNVVLVGSHIMYDPFSQCQKSIKPCIALSATPKITILQSTRISAPIVAPVVVNPSINALTEQGKPSSPGLINQCKSVTDGDQSMPIEDMDRVLRNHNTEAVNLSNSLINNLNTNNVTNIKEEKKESAIERLSQQKDFGEQSIFKITKHDDSSIVTKLDPQKKIKVRQNNSTKTDREPLRKTSSRIKPISENNDDLIINNNINHGNCTNLLNETVKPVNQKLSENLAINENFTVSCEKNHTASLKLNKDDLSFKSHVLDVKNNTISKVLSVNKIAAECGVNHLPMNQSDVCQKKELYDERLKLKRLSLLNREIERKCNLKPIALPYYPIKTIALPFSPVKAIALPYSPIKPIALPYTPIKPREDNPDRLDGIKTNIRQDKSTLDEQVSCQTIESQLQPITSHTGKYVKAVTENKSQKTQDTELTSIRSEVKSKNLDESGSQSLENNEPNILSIDNMLNDNITKKPQHFTEPSNIHEQKRKRTDIKNQQVPATKAKKIKTTSKLEMKLLNTDDKLLTDLANGVVINDNANISTQSSIAKPIENPQIPILSSNNPSGRQFGKVRKLQTLAASIVNDMKSYNGDRPLRKDIAYQVKDDVIIDLTHASEFTELPIASESNNAIKKTTDAVEISAGIKGVQIKSGSVNKASRIIKEKPVIPHSIQIVKPTKDQCLNVNENTLFQNFKDKIQLQELPRRPTDDPLKRLIRVKLPNSSVFRVTISGKLNVDVNSLFSDPQMRSILSEKFHSKKKCTLSIKQCTEKVEIDQITYSEPFISPETINLVSDEEDDEPSKFVMKTQFGNYTVSSNDTVVLRKHQLKLSQKCVVELENVDISNKIISGSNTVNHKNSDPTRIAHSFEDLNPQNALDTMIANENSGCYGKTNKRIKRDTNETIEPKSGIEISRRSIIKSFKSDETKCHLKEPHFDENLIESEKQLLLDSDLKNDAKNAVDISSKLKNELEFCSVNEQQANLIHETTCKTTDCYVQLRRCDYLLSKKNMDNEDENFTQNHYDCEMECCSPSLERSGSFSILNDYANDDDPVHIPFYEDFTHSKDFSNITCNTDWLLTKPAINLLEMRNTKLFDNDIGSSTVREHSINITCCTDWLLTKAAINKLVKHKLHDEKNYMFFICDDLLTKRPCTTETSSNTDCDNSEVFFDAACHSDWLLTKPAINGFETLYKYTYIHEIPVDDLVTKSMNTESYLDHDSINQKVSEWMPTKSTVNQVKIFNEKVNNAHQVSFMCENLLTNSIATESSRHAECRHPKVISNFTCISDWLLTKADISSLVTLKHEISNEEHEIAVTCKDLYVNGVAKNTFTCPQLEFRTKNNQGQKVSSLSTIMTNYFVNTTILKDLKPICHKNEKITNILKRKFEDTFRRDIVTNSYKKKIKKDSQITCMHKNVSKLDSQQSKLLSHGNSNTNVFVKSLNEKILRDTFSLQSVDTSLNRVLSKKNLETEATNIEDGENIECFENLLIQTRNRTKIGLSEHDKESTLNNEFITIVNKVIELDHCGNKSTAHVQDSNDIESNTKDVENTKTTTKVHHSILKDSLEDGHACTISKLDKPSNENFIKSICDNSNEVYREQYCPQIIENIKNDLEICATQSSIDVNITAIRNKEINEDNEILSGSGFNCLHSVRQSTYTTTNKEQKSYNNESISVVQFTGDLYRTVKNFIDEEIRLSSLSSSDLLKTEKNTLGIESSKLESNLKTRVEDVYTNLAAENLKQALSHSLAKNDGDDEKEKGLKLINTLEILTKNKEPIQFKKFGIIPISNVQKESPSNVTLVYKADSELILKGSAYQDPIVGTCYVFPIRKISCDIPANEESLEKTDSLKSSEDRLALLIPKKTYSNYNFHTDSGSIMDFSGKRNLKRKINIYDSKLSVKKYRKSKNIDYPKITVAAMVDSSYKREFSQLMSYFKSVKFSFAIPFHKETFEVDNWTRALPNSDQVGLKKVEYRDDTKLFCRDDDKNYDQYYDPFQQSLSEEIAFAQQNAEYTPIEINENNFKMGFGERSDRVFQCLMNRNTLKVSAATLSDVKHYQPPPTEYCKNYNKFLAETDSIKNTQRFISCIRLKEKVRSFFKKSSMELKYSCIREDMKDDKEDGFDEKLNAYIDLSDFYNLDYYEAPHNETVVQVVQVGQLTVNASAQNPVTCDPRVTQVTDASPSQCSIENSPRDDSQPGMKAEYTELTTADLSMPLVREYERHQSSNILQNESDRQTETEENIPIATEVNSTVKVEITEEVLENEENGFDSNDNDLQNLVNNHINNAAYGFDKSTHSESPGTKNANTFNNDSFTQCSDQNSSTIEKADQIAYAMSAAGIATNSQSNIDESLILTNDSENSKIEESTNAKQISNNISKHAPINTIALHQALAHILPPPLNRLKSSDGNHNSSSPQVLHIVQGKNTTVNHLALVENAQKSVINTPSQTQVLHIVHNKSTSSNSVASAPPPNSYAGLSLVDSGVQQGGNQLLHIVNTGSQKQTNSGQLLKRVNLLTNISNVHGTGDQKMVQFVCKSADGKSIQLNAQHNRGMVLRLQPIESTHMQNNVAKSDGLNEKSHKENNTINSNESSRTHQEIKSRSVYEENYAKFIQNSNKSPVPEKSTSLPKFNQAFGKPIFQDDGHKPSDVNDSNSHLTPITVQTANENAECNRENAVNIDQISHVNAPPLLLRKCAQPSSQSPQANLIHQIKQPVNVQTMHGGVIYTRQIPVNIGGGQTINLITVPSTELVDESNNKQNMNQPETEQSIIKLAPQNQTSSPDVSAEENSNHITNEQLQNSQPPPVLTQMRIKLPMLSKPSQIVSGARVVRPSFFQIQRNVIGGANQPVYQQLVLTAAPPLGQQTIRLPQSQPNKFAKLPTENQPTQESQMSSSTLEQLREFDMVLEQVKERSTIQPAPKNESAAKLHTPTTDSSEATSSSNSSSESTQQILYKIGNNVNIAYVNRKVATATLPNVNRSPESSSASDTPSSSIQSHEVHGSSGETQTTEISSVQHQNKPVKTVSKTKSRPKSSSQPSNSVKVNTVAPKPSTQKPFEDEQTTQRILYILAEYKEQVENSPDKDKPAPRRRSNPPSLPGSSKRKKSSSSSRRHGTRDLSPINGDETRTLGSEDSSCGTSQGDLNESYMDSHSPQDSPRKVPKKLSFEPEVPTAQQSQSQRNVIVADGQTITVARAAAGKPTTAVLMPANYILPVSMVKSGQQIAIVTNRGPKILTVGSDSAGNTVLLQRIIGPGLKPVLARPGVRHVRLPAAALHNIQTFTLGSAVHSQQPDTTAHLVTATNPPELVDVRSSSNSWTDRVVQESKPEEPPRPESSEPWNLTSNPHDYTYEEIVRSDNLDRTVLVVHRKDGSSQKHHRVSHVSAAALRHRYAMLEHELRLQKSLSEECEDLGVDSPSAAELFPEAELLFSSSPAHEAPQHSHTPQPSVISQSSIPHVDTIDDQIATDQLINTSDVPDEEDISMALGLDAGLVTVTEDGATIALDPQEFAKSHPNTTFHREPTDESELQPFTIANVKGRHMTSTIFHATRAPATVLVTTPHQSTVISQPHDTLPHILKFTHTDVHTQPTPSTVLVKDNSNVLTDSRELHLSNTASTIIHASSNATQVIRRAYYDDENREQRFLVNDSGVMMDDVKMTDDSRNVTLESIVDDDDRSTPERCSEIFWESTASERSESRRPLEFSSDSDKCCKSPFEETNSTDSGGLGTHLMRLDSVIKDARGIERSCSADNSSADDSHPPLRTYPAKRSYHHTENEMESVSGKTRAGGSPDLESRRRASNRGVVKRGCHCCNGSPTPSRPKKPRSRKHNADFNH